MLHRNKVTRFERNKRHILLEILRDVTHVHSLPHEIDFSPEHRCNLRCLMCFSTVSRKQGVIPYMDRRLPREDALRRLKKLEPLMPFWQRITLSGSGEPLMNARLEDMLAILNNQNVFITITTNGLFLNRQRAIMLVKHGVHEVFFSVDAGCRETYEKIRLGGKWEQLKKNIETLNGMKKMLGSPIPRTFFTGNFMRMNIEELPDMIDFTAENGGIAFYASKTVLYDRDMQDQDLSLYPDITRKMSGEAAARARRRGILFTNYLLNPAGETIEPDNQAAFRLKASTHLRRNRHGKKTSPQEDRPKRISTHGTVKTASIIRHFEGMGRNIHYLYLKCLNRLMPRVAPQPEPLSICRKPWTFMKICSDGSVLACCYNSLLLGNLNEQTFSEIWNGIPAKKMRQSFLNGRLTEGCRVCPLMMKEMPRNGFPAKLDFPQSGNALFGLTEIHGWAWSPEGITDIDILIDDRSVGKGSYGDYRPDVAHHLPRLVKDKYVGFHCSLDSTRLRLREGYHVLSLRMTTGKDIVEEACHTTVKIQKSRPLKDRTSGKKRKKLPLLWHLDFPQDSSLLQGEELIHGWALDLSGITSIEVLIDGRHTGKAVLGKLRVDVGAAYLKYRNSFRAGFYKYVDTTYFSDGQHTMSLYITTGRKTCFHVAQRKVTIRNISKNECVEGFKRAVSSCRWRHRGRAV